MAAPNDTGVGLPCDDFMGFQEALKKMRTKDDRIVHALNTSLPTISFANKTDGTKQCHQLYDQLTAAYNDRGCKIKHCLKEVANKVDTLRQKREANPQDLEATKQLRKEQTKLRLMQTELGVETIIKERSIKLFYERCRDYYRPSNEPPPL